METKKPTKAEIRRRAELDRELQNVCDIIPQVIARADARREAERKNKPEREEVTGLEKLFG